MHLLTVTAHVVYLILQSITHYGANALYTVRIVADDYSKAGNPLWLNCSCDLPKHQIYSIKWFKDNQEFYSYIESDEEKKRFFSTPGISPDEIKSNSGNVFLEKTDFHTEGNYRCEISSEVTFQTLQDSKYIKVYFIPKDPNPIIIGKKSHYTLNDMVNLTCTSPMSFPAPQLEAVINGTSITTGADSRYQHRVYYQNYEKNLKSTSINIQFSTKYLTSKLNFECNSKIIHKENRSTGITLWTNHKSYQQLSKEDNIFHIEDESIDKDNQTPNDVSEPRIIGLAENYRSGDTVNISCVSSRHKPVPELMWFINSEVAEPKYLIHQKSTQYSDGLFETTLGLRLSLKHIKPLKTFKSNKLFVNLKCVESLPQVLEEGKETLIIPSAVEPISNTVGAVKSFMENTSNRSFHSFNCLTQIFFAFLTYIVNNVFNH